MALQTLIKYIVPADMGDISNAPKKYEGYMLKRRKWPLKGWHKRFFVLEKGFMKYSKSPHDIVKGKFHGILDVGLSVMTSQKKSCRIDLDAEDTIFHLKIKSQASFQAWMKEIRIHREYRQAEMKNDDTLRPETNGSGVTSPIPHSSTSSEIAFDSVEECSSALSSIRKDIDQLTKVLQMIKRGSALYSPMKNPLPISVAQTKKERKLSKKASKKMQKSGSLREPTTPEQHRRTDSIKTIHAVSPVLPINDQANKSRSNPDLTCRIPSVSSMTSFNADQVDSSSRPQSISKSVHSTPTRANSSAPSISFYSSDEQNGSITPEDMFTKHEQFMEMANKVCAHLEMALDSIIHQEEKQNALQTDNLLKAVSQLTKENKEISKENKDLRNTMQNISQIASSLGTSTGSSSNPTSTMRKSIIQQKMMGNMSESQLSISETMSDMFYDAEEYLISDDESSTEEEVEESENGDEDEESTDAEYSEGESMSLRSMPMEPEVIITSGRRTKLPCFRPESANFSLWNILRKNIGKDLSRISMPVTLNEPLNALQCLCEELEYSELLDKAIQCEDPYERMVFVAAFAVSAYASTYTRAGQKPFNPLLGETYECVREDRGFKFIAEQVSHHPPISACHCHSDNFEFWQDARWKNKFWGKSMEILPAGSVHLKLARFNEEYKWNKVTTCVHNIMSGTRWVEHYGEMIITTKSVTCKINFSKSGYWNSKSGEITGTVTDSSGGAKQNIHGCWFESLYTGTGNKARCIWRKSAMPTDYDRYYGFTQFAMELNELDSGEAKSLPKTDTRFRPDQRLLEEGNIDGAETEKQRIEQLQRDRKKQRDDAKQEYSPRFFKKITTSKKDESWVHNGQYWKTRKDPGFSNSADITTLW